MPLKLTKRQQIVQAILVWLGYETKLVDAAVRSFDELSIDEQEITLHCLLLTVAPTKDDCRRILDSEPLCEFFGEEIREELVESFFPH